MSVCASLSRGTSTLLTKVREKEPHGPNIDECFHDPSHDLECLGHKDSAVKEDHAEFREAKPKDREKLQCPPDLQVSIIQRHRVSDESQPLPF